MIGVPTSVVRIAALFLALAVNAAYAQPDKFWCGQRLIREGMAASEIIGRCGDPASIEVVEEPIFALRPGGVRVRTGVAVTEYWIYDRGWGRFPARLTIRDGVAEQIELLSR